MNTSFEDQVRERAYHMWLADGMADGQAHEHWLSAEKAVKAAAPVVIITKAKPARKPVAAKSASAVKAVAAAKATKPVAAQAAGKSTAPKAKASKAMSASL